MTKLSVKNADRHRPARSLMAELRVQNQIKVMDRPGFWYGDSHFNPRRRDTMEGRA